MKTPTAPSYTNADKRTIERAVELLVEDFDALQKLFDAPDTPWTREQVDRTRHAMDEVRAVKRLFDERASVAAVCEQVAVARLFLAEVLAER